MIINQRETNQMTRNTIFVVTYRDASGVTYSDLVRPEQLDQALLTLKREQPSATLVCVDRQGGN